MMILISPIVYASLRAPSISKLLLESDVHANHRANIPKCSSKSPACGAFIRTLKLDFIFLIHNSSTTPTIAQAEQTYIIPRKLIGPNLINFVGSVDFPILLFFPDRFVSLNSTVLESLSIVLSTLL